MESREEAIAAHVKRIVSKNGFKGLLMQYGSEVVSKVERKDGGPHRDSVFAPMALRLARSGVRVFSVLTIPLRGTWQWRGRKGEMLWAPSDASLSTGESLDQLLVRAGRPKFLFVEAKRERRLKLSSHDLNKFRVDAYLLFASAAALIDQCSVGGP